MRPGLRAALATALVVAAPCNRPLGAQSVLQVEGGGNTITGGYGSRVQFWSGAYEGWIGAGYSRGWRLGFFAKRPFGLDTLRVGFDAQPLGVATDLFSGGSYLLTQGAAWRRKRGTFDARFFAGATGSGAGAPFVNTARADKPLGFVIVDYKPDPSVLVQSYAIAARQQTLLESVSWKSDDAVHQLAATGGIGSNKPYASLAWRAATDWYELRAGYTDFARGFRRADAPLPNIAEPYHENVLLTLRAPRRAMVTLGHQNFRQDDTSIVGATRATVDQAVANVTLFGFNLGGGVFQTTGPDGRSLSTFNSINRALPFQANGTLMLFQTFRRGTSPIRTMQAELRERITPRLGISQVFSQTGKSLSVGFGGSFQNGFTTIAFDYQNYYVPLRQPNPFMRALNLTIRLQVGNTSASVGSALDPFGRVTYSASGSTYLYVGESTPGMLPIPVRFDRYVIRGEVVDEAGAPIDGAAIGLGGELALTNSRGEFFVRAKNTHAVPMRVAFDDFLAVGEYEVVKAPASITPDVEERAVPVQIVLRRVVAGRMSRAKGKLLGLQQGVGRPTITSSAPATGVALPPAVPLPARPMKAQRAIIATQCAGTQALLRDILEGAAEVMSPACCRGKQSWHIIKQPLPIPELKRF
jgi:hypothetical protein